MKTFEESSFAVAFLGICAQSKIVHGWQNVLEYIDESCPLSEGYESEEMTCKSPSSPLHDPDNWSLCDTIGSTEKEARYMYHHVDFDGSCDLHIIRITE